MDDVDRQTLMGMTVTFVALAAGYKVIERFQPTSASMLSRGLDARLFSRLDQDLSHSYSTKVSAVRTADGISYIHQTLRTPLRPKSATQTVAMLHRPNLIHYLLDTIQRYPGATLLTLSMLIATLFLAIAFYHDRHSQHKRNKQWLQDYIYRLATERMELRIENEDLESDLDHKDMALQTLEANAANDKQVLLEAYRDNRLQIEDLQASYEEDRNKAREIARYVQGVKIENNELRSEVASLQRRNGDLVDQLAESRRMAEASGGFVGNAPTDGERSLVRYGAAVRTPDIAQNLPSSEDESMTRTNVLLDRINELEARNQYLEEIVSSEHVPCAPKDVRIKELQSEVQYLEEKARGMHTPSYRRDYRMQFGESPKGQPFSGTTPAGRTFDPSDPTPRRKKAHRAGKAHTKRYGNGRSGGT